MAEFIDYFASHRERDPQTGLIYLTLDLVGMALITLISLYFGGLTLSITVLGLPFYTLMRYLASDESALAPLLGFLVMGMLFLVGCCVIGSFLPLFLIGIVFGICPLIFVVSVLPYLLFSC